MPQEQSYCGLGLILSTVHDLRLKYLTVDGYTFARCNTREKTSYLNGKSKDLRLKYLTVDGYTFARCNTREKTSYLNGKSKGQEQKCEYIDSSIRTIRLEATGFDKKNAIPNPDPGYGNRVLLHS
ncbi:hypothetical protein DICVIV_05220 [Dictyocaulus viviparus]|uniref:Uncharacterized protein n=1 Tax=Dictyocaulus viviparus TaxID=29172 RepID=A0A0D8Y240_DICVI|nr:hypothetical protein DICVIV_05220 [Dictyocaulus viviparus]